MSLVDDCIQFLEDLILGDFSENQMVSAQAIGGLISLIPVVDQLMDVRDVSGCLYRINKRGGVAKAGLEDKIDLGFAAFGVVPEVGSAFKTIFKPLYKQRKAVKGAVNGGVAMVERMLGVQKGGAIKWVKTLDWAGNTQIAIDKTNLALEHCIALLDYIAQGHWWCPSHLEQFARDVSPGIRGMRGKLAAPLREAAEQIRLFLEDMLGEHAAAVALTVAGNANSLAGSRHGSNAHASNLQKKPSSRPRSSSAGDRKREPDTHRKVQAEERANGKPASGGSSVTVQRTAFDAYKGLNFAVKGLMGEHIVDHHVIDQKGWGLEWNRHDMVGDRSGKASGWQSKPRKLNENETPIFLCTPSAHVLTRGIDSAWLTNRSAPHEFAVVEAKANMNPAATLLQLLGEANDNSGAATGGSGRKAGRGRRRGGSASPVASSSGTMPAAEARPGKVLQMSHGWILERIRRDFFQYYRAMQKGPDMRNYSRHVFLVSPLQATEHVQCIQKIMEEGLINNPVAAQKYAEEHARHDVQKEFGEADLNAAEEKYKLEGKPKKAAKKKTKDKK